MDINYLLRRHQVSLHYAATSPSLSARLAHRAFANVYRKMLAELGFPVAPADNDRSSATKAGQSLPLRSSRFALAAIDPTQPAIRLVDMSPAPVTAGRTRQHHGWPAGTTVRSLADTIPGRPSTAGQLRVSPDGDTVGPVRPLHDKAA